jgi:hypothetical protein
MGCGGEEGAAVTDLRHGGRGLREGNGTEMGQTHLTTRFSRGEAADGRMRGRVARTTRKAEGRRTRSLADTESRMDNADSTKANRRCRCIEGITMVHGVVYIRCL